MTLSKVIYRYYRRMRSRAGIAALVLGVSLAAPVGIEAWGLDVHRYIMDRAIDRLPPELKPFFDACGRSSSSTPSIRICGAWPAGTRSRRGTFSISTRTGRRRFRDLPRDYDRAVERYGVDKLRQNGLLPWRTAEITVGCGRRSPTHRRERRRLRGLERAVLFGRPQSLRRRRPRAVSRDGELRRPVDGTAGIHARFESELFARYRDRLPIAPPALAAGHPTRADSSSIGYGGLPLVARVLAADRAAAAAHPGTTMRTTSDVRQVGGIAARPHLGRDRRHRRDDHGRLGSGRPAAAAGDAKRSPLASAHSASTANAQRPASKEPAEPHELFEPIERTEPVHRRLSY